MTTAPADISVPSGTGIRDVFGLLLHLSEQDRRGLAWLRLRAQVWRNAIRRRRKYGLPRGATFTSEESKLIGHLTALENAASGLLDLAGKD